MKSWLSQNSHSWSSLPFYPWPIVAMLMSASRCLWSRDQRRTGYRWSCVGSSAMPGSWQRCPVGLAGRCEWSGHRADVSDADRLVLGRDQARQASRFSRGD